MVRPEFEIDRRRAILALMLLLFAAACLRASGYGASARGASAAGGDPPVRVQWIGGPTILIEFEGLRVLTDPVLGQGEEAFHMFDPNTGRQRAAFARFGALPAFDRSRLDRVLLSHTHADHFDDAARAALAHEAPVILPSPQRAEVEALGFTKVEGLDWWASTRLEAGEAEIVITAVPAHHAHAEELDRMAGRVNGYWLEFKKGAFRRSMYWSADTVPGPHLRAIEERLGRPDVLVLHLGAVGANGPVGRFSMNAAEGVEMVRLFAPKQILPIHHSTFSLYVEPIAAFRDALASEGGRARLDLPREGGELRY